MSREQFGQPIGRFQGLSFQLADSALEIEAAQLLTLQAASRVDDGTVTDTDVAMAKLMATETLGRVTDRAVQVFGGMGLVREYKIERWWRDARVERIWDGTSEIQRHIISRALLRPLEGQADDRPHRGYAARRCSSRSTSRRRTPSTSTTSMELYGAFVRLRDDPTLRTAVLTGAGERFFSAGWDLKAAAEGEAVDAEHSPGGFAGLTEFFDVGKPVIAAVNGLAIGGGFELALSADLDRRCRPRRVRAARGQARHRRRLGWAAAHPGARPRGDRAWSGCSPDAASPQMRRCGGDWSTGWCQRQTCWRRHSDLAGAIEESAPLAVAAVLEVTRETEGMRIDEALPVCCATATFPPTAP